MRRAFTIPEVLVASVVMLMMLGLALTLWLDAGRNVAKGEDSLAAIQDASSVMRHLRHDLQRLTVDSPGHPWHLRFLHLRGRALTMNVLTWDAAARGFANAYSASENPGDLYREELTELAFYARGEGDDPPAKVTYTYLPAQKAIRRQEGYQRPQMFALPKLQDFRIQLHYQAEEGGARALLGSETEVTGALLQLWFRVHFVVRADPSSPKVRATEVELDSLVFPRRFHAAMRARWQATP